MTEPKQPRDNSVPNIWAAQEQELRIYKWIACGLGVFIALLFTFLMVFSMRDPLVVVEKQGRHDFHQPIRQNPKIDKSDIEEFSKGFLSLFYVWDKLDGNTLARQISPFVEPALLQKIVDAQAGRYTKELKGKKLAQDLAFVRIQVLSDRIVCRFDRVMKIEGLPLVIPTDLTLSLVQGESTHANPMGVYVAGITEHEGAK